MTNDRHGRLFPASLLVLVVAGSAAHAFDWPQWRGPARDGVAQSAAAPAAWPAALTKAWSVPVGEGHASPIVQGDRAWVHAREGDKEVVTARKLSDGSVLWTQSWDVPYEMHPAATGHGKGPKSTPVLHDGTLFTLGIHGTLTALDAATGTIRWRREMSSRFKVTSPKFGVSASPAVDGELLFAPFGGHHAGTLAALDLKTGEPRWGLDGDGPGYASPVVADLQLLEFHQSRRRVVGRAAQADEQYVSCRGRLRRERGVEIEVVGTSQFAG